MVKVKMKVPLKLAQLQISNIFEFLHPNDSSNNFFIIQFFPWLINGNDKICESEVETRSTINMVIMSNPITLTSLEEKLEIESEIKTC